MGGEQAATVLATITKDQRAREGKEVMIHVNRLTRQTKICAPLERLELTLVVSCQQHKHYERHFSFNNGLTWHSEIISVLSVTVMTYPE